MFSCNKNLQKLILVTENLELKVKLIHHSTLQPNKKLVKVIKPFHHQILVSV